MNKTMTALAGATMALGLMQAPAANAQDVLRLAIGQRGNWDTSVSELGQRAGIFRKHGLELKILYTQGGGETQQAVISGSVEVGIAAGIMGVISAFGKNAPVRIIGAETTGGADLFWYVKADSPLKTLKDLEGRSIAYSTNGSSTHGVVMAYQNESGIKMKPVTTGGPAATLTQVMSGQIDVGWSAPPFGLDLLDQGKIRIIASGEDAAAFRGQTVRLNITNVQTLKAKKDQIVRYMTAYRETVDWMYSSPDAIKAYAEFVGIPEPIARRTRDEFFPRKAIDPDKIVGLDAVMPDAVALKYIPAPLTKDQLAELIQIPPRQ